MTAAQLDHLRAIDVHLDRLLGIAAKRTPGEWKQEDIITNEIWGDGYFICDCMDNHTANASYIAACSNNAEAGWRSTKAAITLLLGFEEYGDSRELESFEDVTTCVLAEWPLETLKP